jgi:hypothetical protein
MTSHLFAPLTSFPKNVVMISAIIPPTNIKSASFFIFKDERNETAINEASASGTIMMWRFTKKKRGNPMRDATHGLAEKLNNTPMAISINTHANVLRSIVHHQRPRRLASLFINLSVLRGDNGMRD